MTNQQYKVACGDKTLLFGIRPEDWQERGERESGVILSSVIESGYLGLGWRSKGVDDLHAIFFQIEGKIDDASMIRKDIETLVDCTDSSDFLLKVQEFALNQKLVVKFCFLRFHSDEPDLIDVYSGGLPPIVKLTKAGFLLPVRRGYPAGVIAEWRSQEQTLLWEGEDEIFVYGEVNGGLRDFHNTLILGKLPTTNDVQGILRIQMEPG